MQAIATCAVRARRRLARPHQRSGAPPPPLPHPSAPALPRSHDALCGGNSCEMLSNSSRFHLVRFCLVRSRTALTLFVSVHPACARKNRLHRAYIALPRARTHEGHSKHSGRDARARAKTPHVSCARHAVHRPSISSPTSCRPPTLPPRWARWKWVRRGQFDLTLLCVHFQLARTRTALTISHFQVSRAQKCTPRLPQRSHRPQNRRATYTGHPAAAHEDASAARRHRRRLRRAVPVASAPDSPSTSRFERRGVDVCTTAI